MLIYLIRRILGIVPVLFIVSILVFSFVHLLPGDPARLLAGADATAEDIALVRQDLGLDQPLWKQYVIFSTNAIQGDFGISLKTKRRVSEEIGERIMPTFWLTLVSMIWATAAGLLIGIISAVRRGRLPDYAGMAVAASGLAMPSFWLGLLLMDLLSIKLRWLPTGGYGTWQQFIMPSITLGVGVAAVMARFTRSAFIDVAREDYVRTARAKGVPAKLVVWKHTLRNALIPVITMIGLQFGFLLGGAVVVENVFAWPGLGRLLVNSIEIRDYAVIQVEILLFALEFILINLLVDVLYALVNPEVRYS